METATGVETIGMSSAAITIDRPRNGRSISKASPVPRTNEHASVPADFDQLVDPMPVTLKFIVPTMMTGDDPMQTKVFVRITLLTADKKEPITLPAFPDRAPALDRS